MEKTYNPDLKEVKLLTWWSEHNIYQKTIKLRYGDKKFYFLDGPPYVTNPPHVGTAWNKFLKDVIIRYKRMRGFNVRDQPGYDCHGLPIEVKVEENLKIKSKKDIEQTIGVAEFISKCKQYAMENMELQSRIFKDLGVWMDWCNPYLTLHKEYMESVWWTIKKAYEKALLVKGLKVVHWCPRCETALSGYEVTDEYRDVADHSIYVKMPLKSKKGHYIIIWTTTPWTLPANIAVMVHPDQDYVEVEAQGEKYIIAKNRIDSVSEEVNIPFTVIRTFAGRELKDLTYSSPLEDNISIQKDLTQAYRVVLSEEYVSMNEGTGCVHCAPGHGEEDYEVGLQNQLPLVSPVDEQGRFTVEAGKYKNKYVKEAETEIVHDLTHSGLLLHHSKVVHSYPHCWRCKTPLIMRAADQWFLKVTAFKNKLLKENETVTWIPRWAGTRRFADWLRGARDWVISRQRYWGVPLPIWICKKCNETVVVGSISELLSRALNPPSIVDLHRDCVDSIQIRCKCGASMHRIPDIVDVWMDSGVASWASLHYPINKETWETWWSADVITEAHDQTRGWFYTQLVTSILCFDKAPYKAVIMHGHTLDSKGQKMSKSMGNFIAPQQVASKYGRDALRLYTLQSTIWDDFRFSLDRVADSYRDLQIMWNVISFASLYMNLDGFEPSKWPIHEMLDHLRCEDRWLLSRTEKVKADVTRAMENFEMHEAARLIRNFIVDDISHWYIRLVRRRFWLEKESMDKLGAYSTFFHALYTWIILAAPFIPFFTEIVYQSVILSTLHDSRESVHMLDWPAAHLHWVDDQLEADMEVAQHVVGAAISARQHLNLKLRQPVAELTVLSDDKKIKKALRNVEEIILLSSNARTLKSLNIKDEKRIEKLIALPNFSVIGPLFKEKAQKIADHISSLDGVTVHQKIQKLGFYEVKLDGELYRITSEMIQFKEEMPEGFARGEFDRGRVYVDSRLSEELKHEGLSREIIRRIQEMRRLMDLSVDAFIEVFIVLSKQEYREWFQEYEDYIRDEVRALKLSLITEVPAESKSYFEKTWIIEGEPFHIGIHQLKN